MAEDLKVDDVRALLLDYCLLLNNLCDPHLRQAELDRLSSDDSLLQMAKQRIKLRNVICALETRP